MKIKTDIKYQFNGYFFSMPIEIDEKGNVYIKDCYSNKEYVISTTNPNKIDTIDYTISKDDNSLEYKAMCMEVFADLESVLEQQGLTVEFEEKTYDGKTKFHACVKQK